MVLCRLKVDPALARSLEAMKNITLPMRFNSTAMRSVLFAMAWIELIFALTKF